MRRSTEKPIPLLLRGRARSGEAGFTLLELLVVLGIMALLASVVAPQFVGYMGRARTDTARAQISALSTALELYSLDNGRYPTQQQGLAALMSPTSDRWRGPYLKKEQGLLDPWGRPYQYRFPGSGGAFDIFTLGRDNAPGGSGEDRDVTN